MIMDLKGHFLSSRTKRTAASTSRLIVSWNVYLTHCPIKTHLLSVLTTCPPIFWPPVVCAAQSSPGPISVWPLAWRGAPAPGPAWGDRHEWSELWAVVVCRMRAEWDIYRHQWPEDISDIATKLSAALLRTQQSPECYEDGRRPQ